jgi:hypothetical protein
VKERQRATLGSIDSHWLSSDRISRDGAIDSMDKDYAVSNHNGEIWMYMGHDDRVEGAALNYSLRGW